jgi:hypothetical protein
MNQSLETMLAGRHLYKNKNALEKQRSRKVIGAWLDYWARFLPCCLLLCNKRDNILLFGILSSWPRGLFMSITIASHIDM